MQFVSWEELKFKETMNKFPEEMKFKKPDKI